MNLAFSKTRSAVGILAKPVSVEVHISNGLPAFNIVGLAETAIKESKDRVRSAIINSQFEFPFRRITVSLAPADLPKSGTGFDLPIAIGILAASGQISSKALEHYEFVGELALSGLIRGVKAVIPMVLAARQAGQNIIISEANAGEAALAGHSSALSASTLREVCAFLNGEIKLNALPERAQYTDYQSNLCLSDVKGQHQAKQAMTIAASGGHSLLMSGSPGSGKTMMAKRFHTLLPPLCETQALECAAIQSIQGKSPDFSQWLTPPFRAPHHTASPVALVGGGNPPKPGEISLAHHGVLFLDELPEFSRHVLETLREPLESGQICISRAAIQMEFPARFQLIAAMNPCPCGHWGNPQADCLCSPDRIQRYLAKLSGPLLDRIDMQLHIQALSQQDLIHHQPDEANKSSTVREQVIKTRMIQLDRQQCLNAALSARDCEHHAALGQEEKQYMARAMEKLKLSARSYHRLLKVARTLADLAEEPKVFIPHLQQALAFRQDIKGYQT